MASEASEPAASKEPEPSVWRELPGLIGGTIFLAALAWLFLGTSAWIVDTTLHGGTLPSEHAGNTTNYPPWHPLSLLGCVLVVLPGVPLGLASGFFAVMGSVASIAKVLSGIFRLARRNRGGA